MCIYNIYLFIPQKVEIKKLLENYLNILNENFQRESIFQIKWQPISWRSIVRDQLSCDQLSDDQLSGNRFRHFQILIPV